MTFAEYINLDSENFEEISKYYLDFLQELSKNNFSYDDQLHFKGSAEKFLNSIDKVTGIDKDSKEKYSDTIERFIQRLKWYRRWKNPSILLFPVKPFLSDKFLLVQNNFEDVFSQTLNLINESNKRKEYRTNSLKLDGFYDPEKSDKRKVKELLIEAVELISSEETLSEKTKKQLISYLNKVIRELDYTYTNWTSVIGKIKETIIVLGALGSIAGGVASIDKIKNKLEETNEEIKRTSVNINFKTLNETYNIQKNEQLQEINNTILKLEENNSGK